MGLTNTLSEHVETILPIERESADLYRVAAICCVEFSGFAGYAIFKYLEYGEPLVNGNTVTRGVAGIITSLSGAFFWDRYQRSQTTE